MPREPTRPAVGAADGPRNSDALENLARVGLIAFGVVHLLVAWLALQLAWLGGGGESADQSGAMATLADSPVGKPLLWVIAVGPDRAGRLAGRRGAALAQRLVGVGQDAHQGAAEVRQRAGQGRRLHRAGGARHPVRHRQRPVQLPAQQETTAGVFGWPGGQFIVGAAGLILIGSGVWHIRKGMNKHFLKQIDTSEASPKALRLVTRLGQIGFPGKGDRARAGRRPARSTPRSPSTRRRPAGWTARCTRCSSCRSARSCSPSSPSASPPSVRSCFVRARYPERT